MTLDEAKEIVLKKYAGAVIGRYGDYPAISTKFAIGAPREFPVGDVEFDIISPVCPTEESAWIFAANRILQKEKRV